jgi:hypothetical protein
MPIGGSATEFNITGAKLKVSGGVQVTGSIAYTTDATGFGGVTAQIDGTNTLNITSGKLTGVANVHSDTAATITAITHTNVNNNTTIHIALKNTSTTRGVFITLGTFASDDTVKVNYTDDYLIGPGETGMLTLRKVNGVLSLFAREMFSSKATSFDATDNSPFYIKDGVNYKYPLYKYTASGLTSEVIQGTTYFRPTAGITTKSRPPKGIPENVTPPSASGFNIGNNGDMTTLEYFVLGVSSNFDFGSITDNGGTTHARFLLTDGEASGTFTESGASSGDSYKLFIEKTNTNLTDTVGVVVDNTPKKVAFHHGAFSASDYSSAYSTVEAAATAGHVYSDTSTTPTYTWGTLGTISSTSTNTTYTWTPPTEITANLLMVAGGGAGGCDNGGAGGAGGLIFSPSTNITSSQTITVGAGAVATPNQSTAGEKGKDTTFGSLTTKGGGCGANGNGTTTPLANMIGGSGGGGDGENTSGSQRYGGTSSQSSQSGDSGTYGYGNAGGNGSGGAGGGGGGAGAAGANGETVTTDVGGIGGDGLKEVTIGSTVYNFATIYGAIFGEVISGESWFAGGGGGANENGINTDVNGGKGGGGKGLGANDQTDNIIKYGKAHTGGGGGGQTHNGEGYAGGGGSGIVIVHWSGSQIGKKIAKVTDITLDSTNESNVLVSTQGTGISTVTYSVNGGSEVSTPVSKLSFAHGLAENVTGTLLAYALDASSARLGSKLSKSITTVYGYETFTITKHTNAVTNLSITGNGTDNITSVYKNSGSNAWDTGFYTPTFTAPITFEFNKTAASDGSDNSVSYIFIGITSTPSVNTSGGSTYDNLDYLFYSRRSDRYTVRSSKSLISEYNGPAWDITKKHYIVYKTNGDLEFWNGSDKKYTAANWGTGKTVRFETSHHVNSSTLTNQMTNIRMKRREWGGTKYIN